MKSFLRSSIAVLLLVLSAPVVSANSAYAANPCTDHVIDTTNNQVLSSGEAAIEANLLKLDREAGIDVRIRAFQTSPGGNLDAYLKQQIASCPDWSNLQGTDLKQSLVVILFTIDDRKSIISVGSNLQDRVGPKTDDLRANPLNSNLANKQYALGVSQVEKKIFDLQTGVQTDDQPSASPGQSGGLSFPVAKIFRIIIYSILGIMILIVLLLVMRGRHRFLQRKATATAARNRCDAAYTSLMTGDDPKNPSPDNVRLLVDVTAGQLSTAGESILRAKYQLSQGLIDMAVTEQERLDENPKQYDPRRLKNETGVVVALGAYEVVLQACLKAQTSINKLSAECTTLQSEIAAAPVALEAQRIKLDQAKAQKDELLTSDYKLPADQLLLAESLLGTVATLINDKHAGAALEQLETATSQITTAIQVFTDLPARRNRLTKLHAELARSLADKQSTFPGLRSEIDRLKATYSRECWMELPKNVDALQSLYRDALSALDTASGLFSMQVQDWSGAESQLEIPVKTIANIDLVNALVTTGMKRLDELAISATGQVADLISEIGRAKSSVQSMRGSQSSNGSQLTAISTEVAKLNTLLQVSRPDYIQFESRLNRFRTEYQSVVTQAKREQQRVIDDERRAEEARQAEVRRRAQEESARMAAITSATIASSSYSSGDSGSSTTSSGGY